MLPKFTPIVNLAVTFDVFPVGSQVKLRGSERLGRLLNRNWNVFNRKVHTCAWGERRGFTPSLGSRKMLLVSDFWKINKRF